MIAALAWGNASLPELLWIGAGVFGLYFKVPNLLAAIESVRAVEMLNGKNILSYKDARIIARARRRREWLRIAMSCIIITVGVVAAASPPMPNAGTHISLTAIMVTVGFFGIQIIDVLQSALDKRAADKVLGRPNPIKGGRRSSDSRTRET